MKRSRNAKPKEQKRKGRAVWLAAAILCVLCAAGAVLFAAFGSEIRTFAASELALQGRYGKAESILKNESGEEAKALLEYAALRRSVQNNYHLLAKSFDIELVTGWRNTAEELIDGGKIKNEKLRSELTGLGSSLDFICAACTVYEKLRPSVLDLMDVFSEYNRLHLRRDDVNVSFTPAEENKRLDSWQKELDTVSRFAYRIPEYEGIYLLSYLLKEGQSEIAALRSDMEKVLASYSGDDTVRYSDDSGRNFPPVKNEEGTSLNIADKEQYESQLFEELGKHLVLTELLGYYSPPTK